MLKKTVLNATHRAMNARMVDFGGWSMPVQYASIVAEHVATRTAVGLFDVSHMGRLRFDGPGAAAWLDAILTRLRQEIAAADFSSVPVAQMALPF